MTRSLLAQALQELNWTSETFAHKLIQYANLHGRSNYLHPKTPYKWVSGHHPRPPWPQLTAELLSAQLRRHITPTDLGWTATGHGEHPHPLAADSGLTGPWTVERALHSMHAVTDADPMERRTFLILTGAAMGSAAHQWLLATEEAPDLAHSGGTRRIQISTVDELDLMAGGLRRLDDHGDGDSLLPVVRAHLRHVVELLESGTYTNTVGRRLYSIAGELLRLAGWLCFDSGAHARAQRCWLAALRAAHVAGDRALAANVIGCMSCQAKDIGEVDQAVTLAESALAGYRRATPRVSAILHLRAAEAHACAGTELRTRAAIEAAFTNLDNHAGDAPDWSYWLNAGHAHGQAGYAFLRLGHHRDARRHLRTAIRLQDPSATREAALRYTLLATTYLREHDLEHALTLAGQAVKVLASDVTSNRVTSHLVTFMRELTPHQRRPDVRHLAESIRSLQPTTSTARN
ncbi:hypothetical protein [Nocardia sp. NPDC052566]|uniref:hypothetical protein n=1 Tax=Nocardia sp. NPDC052566 TaxID=3364330 RepID=UPI0037C6C3EA